jgi:hypothetical protein
VVPFSFLQAKINKTKSENLRTYFGRLERAIKQNLQAIVYKVKKQFYQIGLIRNFLRHLKNVPEETVRFISSNKRNSILTFPRFSVRLFKTSMLTSMQPDKY